MIAGGKHLYFSFYTRLDGKERLLWMDDPKIFMFASDAAVADKLHNPPSACTTGRSRPPNASTTRWPGAPFTRTRHDTYPDGAHAAGR